MGEINTMLETTTELPDEPKCPVCKDIPSGIDRPNKEGTDIASSSVECLGCGTKTAQYERRDDALEAWANKILL